MPDFDQGSTNEPSVDPTLPLETTAAPYLGQGSFAEPPATRNPAPLGYEDAGAVPTDQVEERFTVRPTSTSSLLENYHEALGQNNSMEDYVNDTSTFDADNMTRDQQGSLGEQASEVADQAKSKITEAVQQVQEQAQSRLAGQKDRAADSLGSVANALRQTGQQLQNQQQQIPVDQLVNSAANQVEKVAGYLRETDISQIVGHVESAIRRQPVLALGAAFALGMVGARFLKSSAQRANESYEGGSIQRYGYGSTSYGTRTTPYGSRYSEPPASASDRSAAAAWGASSNEGQWGTYDAES